jgi:hypothetical protein
MAEEADFVLGEQVVGRPTTAEAIKEMQLASSKLRPVPLTEAELYAAGIDALHFLATCHVAGARFLVWFPADNAPFPVMFTVPGLIEKRDAST